ncbi:MAG: ATP phosphoribosyltransferase, partial [Phycisphaeraceae bacterium]|nr:ATP phosphoribosyltransferase [Phycisphaeraceae bacterium]
MTQPPTALLRIGIPKGSLQDSTIDLFDRAGYRVNTSSRSYMLTFDDPQINGIMFRAQEMSRYVEDGVADLGITGHDWIVENGSDVHELCELAYSKATARPVRWVLAVPEESAVQKPEDLAGGIIATELVRTVTKYFQDKNVAVKKIEYSYGATEVKARLVDAIADVTETGSSLHANKLRVIDTVLTSTTRLIVNHDSWSNADKRRKIEDIALLLRGAMSARQKVGLKMNVPKAQLDAVLALLPSERSPTISALAEDNWIAVEVIVDQATERDLVPGLSRNGATGIITYPLN